MVQTMVLQDATAVVTITDIIDMADVMADMAVIKAGTMAGDDVVDGDEENIIIETMISL